MATFQVDRRLRQAQRFSDEFEQPVLFLPFFLVLTAAVPNSNAKLPHLAVLLGSGDHGRYFLLNRIR